MKQLKIFIAIMIACATLTSCVCETYAQSYPEQNTYELYSSAVDYNTVITLGTAYYINNVLQYYIYNNIYYYPYIWEGHRYLHPYKHQQPHSFIFVPQKHHPHPHLGDMYHNRPGIRFDNRNYNYKPNAHDRRYRDDRSFPNRNSSTRMTIDRQHNIQHNTVKLNQIRTQPHHNRGTFNSGRR